MKKRRITPKPPLKGDEYLLDQFSQADLRTWKKFSDHQQEYNVRLFYHLESLREIHGEEISTALQSCTKHREVGKSWFRLVDFKYSSEFLSSKGSLIKGGRFNIGNDLGSRRFPHFPALYVANNYDTAYAEYFGASPSASLGGFQGREFALVPMKSFSAVSLSFELENLFDLSKVSNLDAFTKIVSRFKIPDELKNLGESIGTQAPWLVRTSKHLRQTLLASNWRNYPVQHEIPANPQIFGRLLRDAGIQGVMYPSTKGANKCLAIFTENLDGTNSFVELEDDPPPGITHSKLHSGNWKQLSSLI